MVWWCAALLVLPGGLQGQGVEVRSTGEEEVMVLQGVGGGWREEEVLEVEGEGGGWLEEKCRVLLDKFSQSSSNFTR